MFFNIMPGPPGVSSSTDANASHVRLYRLQRGMTNAIIQDVSVSDESNWILVSSWRGTSHLFAINPWEELLIFQFSDASFNPKFQTILYQVSQLDRQFVGHLIQVHKCLISRAVFIWSPSYTSCLTIFGLQCSNKEGLLL